MPPSKKMERFAKKFLLYFFGGLILMVVLIVVFDDSSVKSDEADNTSEGKDAPAQPESIRYTPCDCADISYNVAKKGGVDAASASDNKKLEVCNELLMDSPSFMAKAKDCPSWLKMNQLFKF